MKDLVKSGIASIAQALRRGDISALDLTLYCLSQIEKLDKELGAFLYVDKKGAVETAKQVDELLSISRKNGTADNISPLLGIPCAVKDNISVMNMPCTCASKILEDFMPAYNATVIKKLKDCGAVILGKTNMDEFAMGSATENSAFKITRNPYDPTRTAGGSSGGSAVAVTSGMCVFALGSDTGGSVRLPASYCNLVGLKPTWGALSRSGLVGFAPAFDAIGILANNASDAQTVFTAVSGKDMLDDTSSNETNDCPPLKIGIIQELLQHDCPDFIKKAMESFSQKAEKLGAEIISVSIPEIKYIPAIYSAIGYSQAFTNLSRFDGMRYGERTAGDNTNTLADTYTNSRAEGFGREVKSRILFGAYVLQGEGREKYFEPACKAKELLVTRVNDLLSTECTAFVLPTSFCTAPKLYEKGSDFNDMCTALANITGLPAITIPAGFEEGLPFGIQLMGQKFSDSKIMSFSEEVADHE